jgi:hypothetical protein
LIKTGIKKKVKMYRLREDILRPPVRNSRGKLRAISIKNNIKMDAYKCSQKDAQLVS